MVFDDATARGSAIASPSEGMVTYTKDDDAIQVYDGSDFVGVGSDSGLIHINTTDFSAVGSQAVTFASATYKNYKIKLDITSFSVDANVLLKMRSGATDDSTNYTFVNNIANAWTGAVTQSRDNAATGGINLGSLENAATNHSYSWNIDLSYLFESAFTTLTGDGVFVVAGTSGADFLSSNLGGRHGVASSFNGINIIASSGNITGKVSIYGYRD
jgi:hypothetical protein